MDRSRERQGNFVFTAGKIREYRFCFNNKISIFAEKFMDFKITISYVVI
jgi:hypothetical protein